ncbi:hypothetical protein FEM41_02110 [Jejubacter calystegiae]|uniref:Uncharacterized protein n=1 Tax=Jejubacter calystegiae TaxID=2579935 RepID=A0A4P8YDF9_9ENTR|nr:hypothetical protein [Jejubacter calystegiae]QCT18519.1 hypothetical protein FEM41_02110 [Jejubacter calystegiae]
MNSARYAILENGSNKVKNVIIAPERFSFKGNMLLKLNEQVICQPGMFYNKANGVFYYDAELTQTVLIQNGSQG